MEGLLVLLFYVLVGIGVLIVGVIFYLRAGLSRATYTCPKCQTRVRVELMEADHCNVCGARLVDPYEEYSNESYEEDDANGSKA